MAANPSLYLYAIVNGSSVFDMRGIEDQPVYTIVCNQIAAVVSDFGRSKIRPERRHLLAHQAVLQKIMQSTTPLPFAFGIIPDDRAIVEELLKDHYDEFAKQLSYVADHVEYSLKITWDVPNIFDYMVFLDGDLRNLRNSIFNTTQKPSVEQKIALGKLFEQKLDENRARVAEQVVAVLGSYCKEIRLGECRKENEAINAACLVRRDAQEDFKEGICSAAQLFDNSVSFDYNGPWAPHQFVKTTFANAGFS